MVLGHDLEKIPKTEDVKTSQDVTFETILLSPNTLEGLKSSGFIRPSPVQLHGIPLGKCGFDLILEAKSGTGKTAVFTVIALEKLDLVGGLQTVILAPTREIAAQVCDVLRQIGCKYDGLQVEVVMGGLPVAEDIEKFKNKKVQIVVGSPGRLKHLIDAGHLDTSAVRLLVLDEADKLMEKSFLPDIQYIHSALPPDKQVILSSATYPESCKQFIKEFVQEAQHVCPNSDCVLLGIDQNVTHVKLNSNSVVQTTNRFNELLKIITTKQFKQCLIFCNYRARVGEVYKMLTKAKWPAEQLHGTQAQVDRLDALKTLQEYKCRILITTDLAARGIDASNVDLVINFEPPLDWQTYLHRIGRAGRFGSYGTAITILSKGEEEKKFMDFLSAVNLSVNLKPLWTEDESAVKKSLASKAQDHSQLNDSNSYNSSELWKIICGEENSSDSKNIEDFHELFNSFQNSNTNQIESFSDLIDSFQNKNLLDAGEVQYRCIKLPNLSKQYLIGIKNILQNTAQETNGYETGSQYANGSKSTKETNVYEVSGSEYANRSKTSQETKDYETGSEYSNGSKESAKNIKTKSSNKMDNNSQGSNIKDVPPCKHNSKISNHDKFSKHIENNLEKLRSIESNNFNGVGDITKMYSKHKFSNVTQTSSSSSNEDFEIVNDKSNSTFKTTSKVKKSQSNRSYSVHNNRKKTLSTNDCNEDIGSDKSNTKCKTDSKVRKHISNKLSDQNCASHCSNDKSDFEAHTKVTFTEEYQCSNAYKEWYKKLKIRVKQIELAIYIDELSKL